MKTSPNYEAYQRSATPEDHLRLVIDTIPGFVWSARPDGYIDFLNQRWQEYTGLTLEEASGWGWEVAIHPQDLPGLVDYWRGVLASGEPGEAVARLRRFDGAYRWFLFRAVPLYDALGNLVRWYGQTTDIDDRQWVEALLAGEKRLLEMVAKGHSLSLILDALSRLVEETASGSLCSILLVDSTGRRLRHGAAPSLPLSYTQGIDEIAVIALGVGPCSSAAFLKEPIIARDFESDDRWPDDYRARASAHGLRACWSTPILSQAGTVLGTFALYYREPGSPTPKQQAIIDQFTHLASIAIERTQAEEALRRSEAYLSEAQKLSHTGSFGWNVASGELIWSDETYRIVGLDQGMKPTVEQVLQRVHPEDVVMVQRSLDHAVRAGTDLDFEHRLVTPERSVKHVRVVARALRDEKGTLEYVGAVTDVTATKKAEERIRQDERELRQIIDLGPQFIIVMAPDGRYLYANQRVLDYTGCTQQDVVAADFRERIFHPEDLERLRDERRQALARGVPFELEQRARRKDGQYRWFLTRLHPLQDEQGRIIRWYAMGTDIDDRVKAEERTRNENLALRDQIDRDSMFEDIVGSSEALGKVLRQVSKVAPSDSTVLILGETGTGKELIARAIHKRSHRAERAFIAVNCAAIPPSLIASELFGHEKGAFTGATQRRLGRFESANGGTIFLDEVGDLPPEIQIALLRVLQEREIERVGSNRPISVDVRVLAATHRDLNTLVAEGTFRQDLLYRLNVVPIEMPSLRARAGDIPLLVEYFIDRFGKKAGKKFRTIEKRTLKLFQAYGWPGNVRELQNVIERAVILCDGDTFSVDETWLKREARQVAAPKLPLHGALLRQEKEMIETALREAGGLVGGPNGAAAKLGIPRETLNSKIRKLGIKRHLFKKS